MQTRFEEDAQISSQDPLVIVRADQLAGEAKTVLDYLEHYKAGPSGVLPIKSDDKLVMLKTEDIILADINQTTLMIYSTEGIYTTTETLTRFQNRSIVAISFRCRVMQSLTLTIWNPCQIAFRAI